VGRFVKIVVALFLILTIFGCDSSKHVEREKSRDSRVDMGYVDFKRFAQERPCAEVRFMCLPESQDKSWQEQNLSDGLDRFELTPEVERKYERLMAEWNREYAEYMSRPKEERSEPLKKSYLVREFFDRVEEKRFLVYMEEELAKEFPGFWRDVPKEVRYRWIRRAMNKAKRFGIKSKGPGAMVELCARIGLDFDKDPKWDYITKFIAKDPKNYVSIAINYIDWTVFGKTHARTGTRITDWLMRRAHPGLPYPKKPYPKLND